MNIQEEDIADNDSLRWRKAKKLRLNRSHEDAVALRYQSSP